jgi:tetratricopeptide (TPR) repeat protein
MQRPDDYIVLFNKGYVNYVYLEDNETALNYFNQALDINPKYLDAFYNKGRVIEQMGDYAQAMEIYKEILRLQPEYQLAIDAVNRIQNQITE